MLTVPLVTIMIAAAPSSVPHEDTPQVEAREGGDGNEDAGYNRWLTVGVGGRAGYVPGPASRSNWFSAGVSVQVRALYVLGAELAFDPYDRFDTRHGTTESRFKLSAILHVIPTWPVGLYLKGGVGGDSLKEAVRFASETPSYHAGAGLLVSIWHVALGLEALAVTSGPNGWSLEDMRRDRLGQNIASRVALSAHIFL